MGAEINNLSYNAFFYFKYRVFTDPAVGGDEKDEIKDLLKLYSPISLYKVVQI